MNYWKMTIHDQFLQLICKIVPLNNIPMVPKDIVIKELHSIYNFGERKRKYECNFCTVSGNKLGGD